MSADPEDRIRRYVNAGVRQRGLEVHERHANSLGRAYHDGACGTIVGAHALFLVDLDALLRRLERLSE